MNKLLTILIILTSINAYAQFGNSRQGEQWNASWITSPDAVGDEAGLFLFRKKVDLETVPSSFNVSAFQTSKKQTWIISSIPAR